MVVDSSQLAAGNANLLAQQQAGQAAAAGGSGKEGFEASVDKAANTVGKFFKVNADSLFSTGLFKSYESAGLAASMINKAAAGFSSSGGFLAKLFDAIKSEGMKLMDWASGVGGGAAIESSFTHHSFSELGNLPLQSLAAASPSLDVGMSGAGHIG